MPPRVDFYLSEEAGDAARLRLACRVTEKAYLAKQRVVVYSDDATLLPRLDDLLWTFGDGSFVPHDTCLSEGLACEAPVVLTTGPLPGTHTDVLINLPTPCRCSSRSSRAAEFLDARPEVRSTAASGSRYIAQAIEPRPQR